MTSALSSMLTLKTAKPSSSLFALALLLAASGWAIAQTPTPDPWRIAADKVDPRNYYGCVILVTPWSRSACVVNF